ncbi:tail assembly chaperone [Bacillus spizizenii]|uniref:tail assembly chaperone n=1 Tax=Bacillus spizizenii TaxID=96241 RepID=UPI002FC59BDA
MATFKLGGKEYELKLTYESVKYLNKQCQNGALELVGKALAGDFEIFPHVIHAGLFHAGKNFALETVENEIEKLFEEEKIDMEYVMKTGKEVVADSFFYKSLLKKMMKDDPKAMEALEELLS